MKKLSKKNLNIIIAIGALAALTAVVVPTAIIISQKDSTSSDYATSYELKGDLITLKTENEKNEYIETKFRKNPKRIAVLSYSSLDIIDSIGLGDNVVGSIIDKSLPSHLSKYKNDNVVNLGSMKAFNIEAIMSLKPDVIFSSDRTASYYKDLVYIAPTYCSFVDYSIGYYNGFKQNLMNHTEMFDKTDEVNTILNRYDSRINAIKTKASNSTAMIGLMSGGKLNLLGNKGRASIITTDMGFKNVYTDNDINHGVAVSQEIVREKNPDYLFLLDKDYAVGSDEAFAQTWIDTNKKTLEKTNCFINNRITILSPGSSWYLSDGGLISMDHIITNIETVLAII